MASKPPLSSKSPPPLDPGEIGAVVCTNVLPSFVRKPEMIPSLMVIFKPSGAPIANTC